MKYKISWFLVISLPVILFFLISYTTIKKINTYFSLNLQTNATIDNFDIINNKKNSYKALVCYSFKVKDKTFKNKIIYSKNFLNYMNANEFVEKLSHDNLPIWFNKKNPNISSFEKIFPIKNCVYVIITFIIFIYFLILKYYVYSFQKSD